MPSTDDLMAGWQPLSSRERYDVNGDPLPMTPQEQALDQLIRERDEALAKRDQLADARREALTKLADARREAATWRASAERYLTVIEDQARALARVRYENRILNAENESALQALNTQRAKEAGIDTSPDQP
jgi:chromosome segregation ATPase